MLREGLWDRGPSNALQRGLSFGVFGRFVSPLSLTA